MTTAPAPPASLDALRSVLDALPEGDATARSAASEREPQLTKPPGALGRLEDIAAWLAAWQGRHPPAVNAPHAVVFAGNHGIADAGVSAFPAAVTAQMVANFQAGGAAINQIAAVMGCGFSVVPLDLETPTRSFLDGPAMADSEVMSAFAIGWEAIPDTCDLLAIGEMGIANTTVAAALSHALFGGEARNWVGPGTGVAGSALDAKTDAVRAGVARHGPDITDGLDALTRLGGRELAAMAGAIVSARFRRIPVILDGYVATAAAACLARTQKASLDHCLSGHRSAEPAHGALLDAIGLTPILDLGLRLGEASGAALAVGVVRAACACHTNMATFDAAQVAGKVVGPPTS